MPENLLHYEATMNLLIYGALSLVALGVITVYWWSIGILPE